MNSQPVTSKGPWRWHQEVGFLASLVRLQSVLGEHGELSQKVAAEVRELASMIPWNANPKYRRWLLADLVRYGVPNAENFNPLAIACPPLRLVAVNGERVEN